MTLTIPTSELVGCLTDVIPFASPDAEDAIYNTVRLEWDGESLHTLASDRRFAGWSRWNPDDEPAEGEPAEDDLFTTWGGDDGTWSTHLSLADAVEAVKMFKLPAKQGRIPLTVEVEHKLVTVRRGPDGGHSAITLEMATDPAIAGEYGDPRAVIDTIEGTIGPVDTIRFDARRLAAFAKVRNHGPMRIRFSGDDRPAWVGIGTRFSGLVAPIRPDSEPADV